MTLPWEMAVAVFMGTLPLLFILVWNLIEVKEVRKELIAIRAEISLLRERVAVLEERERQTHPLVR